MTRFFFHTIKPGAVVGRKGAKPMAPRVNFRIAARGINIGRNTRMYLSNEASADAADRVLELVERDSGRTTLIAQRDIRDGKPVYTFDIRIQGEREMAFFDV